MTSRIRSLCCVSRSILCVSMLMPLVALALPMTARAEDMVLKWNEIAARTVTTAPPYPQARVMSIVQLAVFEAVNAINGGYEPYLDPPTVAPAGASVEAAVVTAAHRVLTNYFPAAIPALDAARDDDLDAIPDGTAKTNGIAVGLAAANAMIALRMDDGSAPVTTFMPTSTMAGDWQLTTGCAAGVFFNWQDVKPFGVEDAKAYLLDPPPALTSNLYLKDYYEVKTMGAANSTERSTEQSELVRLVAATSPTLLNSMAARQIATDKGLSMSENSRALALIMMSINDSLIASFYNKYHHNLWRPETGIRNGATDGNDKTEGDTGFTTFIPTPCFPSYASNASSGNGGGLEAQRRLFGAAGHDITITNNVPMLGSLPPATISRHYTQLDAIEEDIKDARVFGGIHWRFDQIAADVLGRRIATEVVKNNLRPIHP
jgi:hypothetical protein